MNYYNEFEPHAAAWLRELIKQNLIPNGHVDERSIVDVRGSDLGGYTQCHFFAGIGGWPLALRLSGWPEARPIWTGSCPCQPFSVAGKQAGFADKRHLWPEFKRLIGECRPTVVFGEQVASPLGRKWLSGVFTDLEDMGYAAAGADLCAACIGAPHIRQRLYWVADAQSCGCKQSEQLGFDNCKKNIKYEGDAYGVCSVGNAIGQRLEGCGEPGSIPVPQKREREERHGSTSSESWDIFDTMYFKDGKKRRTQPGLIPLANGIPARMVRLRGYGNAIVPPLAAEFIRAFMSIKE